MAIVCNNYNSDTIYANKRTFNIPKQISLKVNLYDINKVDNLHLYNIMIPPNISSKLRFINNNTQYDFTKFVPKYSISKETLQYNFIKAYRDMSNNSIEIAYKFNYMQNKIIREFNSFDNNFNMLNITPSPNDNSITLVDNMNNTIHINNNFALIIINNIICVIDLTYHSNMIMFSSNFNYIASKESETIFKVTNKNDIMSVYSVMKNKNKIQNTMYNINSNNDVTTTYYYEKYENDMKLLHHTQQKSNGDILECYIKRNMYVEHTFNTMTNTDKLVSRCMMNDMNTGLRYRGTYEETKNSEETKKLLSRDDTIIYNKENNLVLVDEISNRRLKDEIVIGWKVAKSLPNEYGEKRIIKLGIPADALIVKPIDKEYFNTRGKERCNKAIVMDIQFAMDEEISLVPSETSAYSYIFNENGIRFEYKVGMEVLPDMFDPNEDESCTHGIHFYRDRKSVFDVYVNA